MRYWWVVSLLLLSGCASITPEQCAVLDWRGAGKSDGLAGRPEQPDRYGRACLDYGISPDYLAYSEGYKQGVSVYCQPGKGYAEGRAGHDYQQVCPATLEPAFLKEYQKGVEIYRKEQESQRARQLEQERLNLEQARLDQERRREQSLQFEITRLKSDIFYKELELERQRWRLNDTRKRLRDAETPAPFVSSLNSDAEIRRLKQEIKRLNKEISSQERKIEKAKDRLTTLLAG